MRKLIPFMFGAVILASFLLGRGSRADLAITPIAAAAADSLRVSEMGFARHSTAVTFNVQAALLAGGDVRSAYGGTWACTPSALPADQKTAVAVLRRTAAQLLVGTPVAGFVAPAGFTPVAVVGTIQ